VTAVNDIETVSLDAADGRILARDILAPLPLPPFTNSAVDGYAVRGGDLRGGGAGLSDRGARPGWRSGRRGDQAEPGDTDFTARRCQGADTKVFMREDVRLDEDGRVVLPAGLETRRQCAPAGEDIPLGHRALKAGQGMRRRMSRSRRRSG
jgi:molybdopterin molybdotransferase